MKFNSLIIVIFQHLAIKGKELIQEFTVFTQMKTFTVSMTTLLTTKHFSISEMVIYENKILFNINQVLQFLKKSYENVLIFVY